MEEGLEVDHCSKRGDFLKFLCWLGDKGLVVCIYRRLKVGVVDNCSNRYVKAV